MTADDPAPRVAGRTGPGARGGDARRTSPSLGLDLVPGTGLLAGDRARRFGGWLTLLRDHGTLPLRDVLALRDRVRARRRTRWCRGSRDTIARGLRAVRASTGRRRPRSGCPAAGPAAGAVPQPGAGGHVAAAAAARRTAGAGREAQIDAAPSCLVHRASSPKRSTRSAATAFRDDSGRDHAGLLTGDDLASGGGVRGRRSVADVGDWRVVKRAPGRRGRRCCSSCALLRRLPRRTVRDGYRRAPVHPSRRRSGEAGLRRPRGLVRRHRRAAGRCCSRPPTRTPGAR